MARISKTISEMVESDLTRCGMFYRLFHRVKSDHSVVSKIRDKGYSAAGKKLQDSIGLRVTLYFDDDIELFVSYLKRKFKVVGETIDHPDVTHFAATRINLIFEIPDDLIDEFKTITFSYPEIDSTFEIQVRTMLSEGWHEVEHDLRYKCKDDWEDNADLSRTLNGVYAALETSDWSMLKIFDEMSYRFYKQNNLTSMVRHKFRLRYKQEALNNDIEQLFNSDHDILKALFRSDRQLFISTLLNNKVSVPLNTNNILYLANLIVLKNEVLTSITPAPIVNEITPYI